MIHCPPRATLEHLLTEQLSAEDRKQLDKHIAQCEKCQTILDALTEDPERARLSSVDLEKELALSHPEINALLAKLQQIPAELTPGSGGRGRETVLESTIRFPGPQTSDAPLGQLGSYHIVEQLGAGANGLLFKARDSKLNRTVAIKVLRRELASMATARARFEREARAAASLKHDHIVTVHDVGSVPDFPPYLVMEYIAGESLSSLLKRQGALPPREAARIVQQVANGLAAAHARGLVHRDIKPSNIMIEEGVGVPGPGFKKQAPETNGQSSISLNAEPRSLNPSFRAKITDFGLARIPEAASGITQEGAIAGTPAYMSPEQMTSPREVDGRCDIYGLGVVLYELLTGEVPFRGVTRMILLQVLHDDPRPPRRLNDKIPADLETICLKAMAKEPGRRYQVADEFAADLARWQAGEPIHARPIGQTERFWRWSKRKPWVAGLGAAVLVLLITVAFGSSVAAIRIATAKDQVFQSLQREQRARADTELARLDADQAKNRAEDALERERRARNEAELAQKESDASKRQMADSLSREKQSRGEAEAARRAAEAAQVQTSEALEREKQARLVAQKSQRDAEAARAQAESSALAAAEQRELALRSLNRLGAAALEVLLQDTDFLEKAGKFDEALGRYEQVILLIRENTLTDLPPLVLHSQVLEPALKLVPRFLQPVSDANRRRRVAEILAMQGTLIVQNPGESWPFDLPFQVAADSFDQAIGLAPSQGSYYSGRAEARLQFPVASQDAAALDKILGDLEQASRLDQSNPRLAGLFARLGKVSHARGELGRADQAFAKAIRLARTSELSELPDFVRDWTWNALAGERLAEARDRAEELQKLDAAAAALVFGESYEREGQLTRALESYEKGIEHDPTRSDNSHVLLLAAAAQAHIRIANNLETPKSNAARNRTKAVDYLRQAVQLAPQHSMAWFWRGLLARQLKVFMDAETDQKRQASYRQEASSELSKAIETAPPNGLQELGKLKLELEVK